MACLPGLSPVIDYQEQETARARYVHALHLRALGRVLRPDRRDRFLDYGCGVGRLAAWLAPQVGEVIGIDPSPAMIAEAHRRVRATNLRLLAVEGAPRGLPHLRVNGVICIWVLQHILDEEDFAATLDYLASVLIPGGSLFTLDRLCREPVPEVGDYICIRQRGRYLRALADRGLRLRSARAISIGEQVLGSPRLSRWAGRHERLHGLLATLELRWAGRQADPFLADMLCHFSKPQQAGLTRGAERYTKAGWKGSSPLS